MSEQQNQDRPSLGELVVVEVTHPSLDIDFDALEQALEARLSEYQTIVTADGVGDAKKAAKEINALASRLDERRREVVSEVSEPIRAFEDRMKRLRDRAKEARQGLLEQVAQFEQQLVDRARDLLESELASSWDSREVREDFRRASVSDLAKVSALTPKGDKLTKGARDAVAARADADLSVQQMVDRRALELENRCYRAGLSVPLSVDNVRHAIEVADEAAYAAEVDRLIDAEYQRQQEQERIARERAEREARARTPEPEPEPEAPAESDAVSEELATTGDEIAAHDEATREPAEQEVPEPPPAPPGSDEQQVGESLDGTKRIALVARFEVDVPMAADPDRVAALLTERILSSGFDSLVSVTADDGGA